MQKSLAMQDMLCRMFVMRDMLSYYNIRCWEVATYITYGCHVSLGGVMKVGLASLMRRHGKPEEMRDGTMISPMIRAEDG